MPGIRVRVYSDSSSRHGYVWSGDGSQRRVWPVTIGGSGHSVYSSGMYALIAISIHAYATFLSMPVLRLFWSALMGVAMGVVFCMVGASDVLDTRAWTR